MTHKILFLDILTVPQKASFHDLENQYQALWQWKSDKITPLSNDYQTSYFENAGIYAEFGKLGGFAIGYHSKKTGTLRIKTFINNDEKLLLTQLNDFLEISFKNYQLCAHHGKEFDYPFLARRMLINSIQLPTSLKKLKTKPWNHPHLDTMDFWKFGDKKNFTPLALLTSSFGYDDLPLLEKGILPTWFYENKFDLLENRLNQELKALYFVYDKLKTT